MSESRPGRQTPRPSAGTAAPARRRWARVARALLLVFLLPIAKYAINTTSFADRLVGPLLLSDTGGPADTIVVPAASITGLCTPNLYSIRRTFLAVRLYKAGRAPHLLFTGGTPEGFSCAVADVMADLAGELGVPAEAISVETASRTTWENALLSAPILAGRGARRVLVVTDSLHMKRAEASFAAFGFATERASVRVAETGGDNTTMLYFGLREYIGGLYYRARGWIGRPPAPLVSDLRPQKAWSMNMNPNGGVVVLGASYAAGWKLDSVAGRPVLNKGVSGQQSFELLARFQQDVVAHRPRAVILWGFINDIFRSPRDQVERAQQRARTSFESLVTAGERDGIEPILATEVTVRHPNAVMENLAVALGPLLGRESYQQYVNGQIGATNRWLRDFARQRGLLLLDFERVLADQSGLRRKPYAVDDGSHISAEGYAALTAYAVPLLEERLGRR